MTGSVRKKDDFLNSIGVCSTISKRGEVLEKTAECAAYMGIRWFRAGYESGVTTDDLVYLYEQTGAKTSYGLLSGGADIPRLLAGGERLAQAGALLAFEGPNEPNNWAVTFNGQKGGGEGSWQAVADLQRALYAAVKAHPVLREYPVFGVSETGAQNDDAGLQFLDGFADYANVHNYCGHPSIGRLIDNMTWHAADPVLEELPEGGHYNGIFKNHGRTWRNGFKGYDADALAALPRVTTECGIKVGDYGIDEVLHGRLLVNTYLAQFARGFAYTAVYLLRDRTDEEGNQQFGFFRPDYTPRPAADLLHTLTRQLDTPGRRAEYEILDRPDTVHDLLLESETGRHLILWSERYTGGADTVVVQCGNAPPTKHTITNPVVL